MKTWEERVQEERKWDEGHQRVTIKRRKRKWNGCARAHQISTSVLSDHAYPFKVKSALKEHSHAWDRAFYREILWNSGREARPCKELPARAHSSTINNTGKSTPVLALVFRISATPKTCMATSMTVLNLGKIEKLGTTTHLHKRMRHEVSPLNDYQAWLNTHPKYQKPRNSK